MIDINESERESKINEAINYGLINKHVVEMVDKFVSKNNLNKSSFADGVIDPGLKSVDSLLSKMYRKTHLELNEEFALTDVKDIIRCSIIVDNYNQVIPLIRELRKSLPSLKGDICENEMGYIGVHLFLTIDGFNAEMQISTREAWYAKQAGEEIYGRWRDFSLSKEVSDIHLIKDEVEKKKRINQLFSLYNRKTIQSNYCKNMFSSLHKYTKLDKLKENINAVLYLNTHKNDIYNENKVMNKYKIKIKDMKSKKELIDSCLDYLSLANKARNSLIEYANNALKIIDNSDASTQLTNTERDFIIIKKKYFSLLTESLKNKFNGKFEVSKYISKLNKISNKLAYNNLNYLKTNNIDNLVIEDNNMDIANLEEIVRKDIFSKSLFLSLIQVNDKQN